MSLKNQIREALGCKRMSALPAGETAPEFSLSSTSAQKISLAEALKKGPVLAAFFKVSCPTCQFTMPFLERLHETYGGASFSLLGISQDNVEPTREFCAEYGLKFPAMIDAEGYPASNQYGITNVPTLFLIGSDGKIQNSSVGFSKADLETIAASVARATGKSPAPLFKAGEVVPATKAG
jgi:peroxiredoxin